MMMHGLANPKIKAITFEGQYTGSRNKKKLKSFIRFFGFQGNIL
jgi:hypothetical protein